MRALLITIGFAWTLNANAQLMDSVQDILRGKRGLDARIESRISFIRNQVINVTGARLGVSFERRLRIGGGISWLNSAVTEARGENWRPGDNSRYLKFVYVCYYIDFVFHRTKRWQLNVPIQLGTGMSWYQRSPEWNINGSDAKYLLLIYEPGITVQYKVLRWFGLGTDVAFRFTVLNNSEIGSDLNSPTYSFKLLFWFDQLYFELFPDSRLTKKYGPATW